ncbi:unnamed protein product [Paramecium primaurelia]|uniref:Uncharacterized protein n=1 Tax=Paramecium primaurelia TaxID=5886 RepID=A0A8S1KC92_PARPR|nr:unnamed protein product [Paramecium primaurelia]
MPIEDEPQKRKYTSNFLYQQLLKIKISKSNQNILKELIVLIRYY